jgi:hypothetical protein
VAWSPADSWNRLWADTEGVWSDQLPRGKAVDIQPALRADADTNGLVIGAAAVPAA